MYHPHASCISAGQLQKRAKIASAIRLASQFLFLVVCGLYGPLIFPKVRRHLVESNVGYFLSIVGLIYELVSAHLVYMNSHLNKKTNERAKETASITWMVGFFQAIVAMGIGLQIDEGALAQTSLFAITLSTALITYGHLIPFIDVSVGISFLLMICLDFLYEFSFGGIILHSLAVLFSIYFILAALERYYVLNIRTMYDEDSQYYAVLAIVPNIVLSMWELVTDRY